MATVGELEANAVADTLADKLSEIKAETHGYALGPVDSQQPMDTLTHTLAEVVV